MSSGGGVRQPFGTSAYRPEPYRQAGKMMPNGIFYAMGGPTAEPSGSERLAGCPDGRPGR
jgi:hypothetical protein